MRMVAERDTPTSDLNPDSALRIRQCRTRAPLRGLRTPDSTIPDSKLRARLREFRIPHSTISDSGVRARPRELRIPHSTIPDSGPTFIGGVVTSSNNIIIATLHILVSLLTLESGLREILTVYYCLIQDSGIRTLHCWSPGFGIPDFQAHRRGRGYKG